MIGMNARASATKHNAVPVAMSASFVRTFDRVRIGEANFALHVLVVHLGMNLILLHFFELLMP